MTLREFLQGLLGIVCGITILGTGCSRLYMQSSSDYNSRNGYMAPDLSWEHVASLYNIGMLIMFCGLVALRLSRLRDEAKYGPDLHYGAKESDRTGIWGSLLFWVPALPDRSESYLWSFTLLSTLLTFFLRDQTLNWVISVYGFRDPHTVFWDWTSLICAPLSAIVLTIRWLALWRTIMARC